MDVIKTMAKFSWGRGSGVVEDVGMGGSPEVFIVTQDEFFSTQ